MDIDLSDSLQMHDWLKEAGSRIRRAKWKAVEAGIEGDAALARCWREIAERWRSILQDMMDHLGLLELGPFLMELPPPPPPPGPNDERKKNALRRRIRAKIYEVLIMEEKPKEGSALAIARECWRDAADFWDDAAQEWFFANPDRAEEREAEAEAKEREAFETGIQDGFTGAFELIHPWPPERPSDPNEGRENLRPLPPGHV